MTPVQLGTLFIIVVILMFGGLFALWWFTQRKAPSPQSGPTQRTETFLLWSGGYDPNFDNANYFRDGASMDAAVNAIAARYASRAEMLDYVNAYGPAAIINAFVRNADSADGVDELNSDGKGTIVTNYGTLVANGGAAVVVGVKPPKSTVGVMAYSPTKWSKYDL